MTEPSQIGIADRVRFSYQEREHVGSVIRKGTSYVQVVCDDHRVFRVPYQRLTKVAGAAGSPVPPGPDSLRGHFHVNDDVSFAVRGVEQHGRISRLNPTRAHVVCEDEKEYRVPYAVLTLVGSSQPPTGASRGHTDFEAIASMAKELMARYGLHQWRFAFDNATKRAGCCHYTTQQISLAYAFARQAPAEEIRETLLHEIAHALVGKDHQHDAVWRAKALEIGCSGRRCHDVQFAPPRYIVTCANHCWVATGDRRRHGVVCARCRGHLVYLTYTEERWTREQAIVTAGGTGET